jgi:hypothetical protein
LRNHWPLERVLVGRTAAPAGFMAGFLVPICREHVDCKRRPALRPASRAKAGIRGRCLTDALNEELICGLVFCEITYFSAFCGRFNSHELRRAPANVRQN